MAKKGSGGVNASKHLFHRQQETLKAYLKGPHQAHFSSQDYEEGLCDQRNTILRRHQKAGIVLFMATTLLVFYDHFSNQKVSIFAVDVTLAPFAAIVLAFVVAVQLLRVVLLSMDFLSIEGCMDAIAQSKKIYSMDIYFLHRTSTNFWISALQPKYFGAKSGSAQKLVSNIIVLIMLAVFFLSLLYPTVVSALVAYDFLHSDSWKEVVFAIVTFPLLALSWIVIILFSVKFKFDEADFDESHSKPTPQKPGKIEAKH